MLKPKAIDTLFARFAKAVAEPKTELYSTNPYTLLVAVILSAQATDAGVNKATPALFKLADTPKKMLALGEEKLTQLVKTIGLYRAKAKNIILMSQMLLERFGGKVPQTVEELETLPGVGEKTARVVMNCTFGAPLIAVDTHVFRVSNRLGLVKETTVKGTQEALAKRVPDRWKPHAHHWLILHGRYICKARKPLCYQCLAADICEFPEKNLVAAA